jgi:hypothetical protein
MPREPIQSPISLYIKLGESGSWEAECIKEGTLRLGYQEIPHELCIAGRWPEAEKYALAFSKDQGAATRHVNQVRLFYETPSTTIWITFHADRLWWCFGEPNTELRDDGTKLRRTTDGWHDRDICGGYLYKAILSGKLLATQGFQGTICSVAEHEYLLHKINGTVEPHVSEAQDALQMLVGSLVPIIKRLHPKDLEILTDLIFRQAGWSRTGVAGGIERDIDLDLISPITHERIAVQVKSRASEREYLDYRDKYTNMRSYKRFYFVTHSPSANLERKATELDDHNFVFWGPQELAQYAARNGLVGWLLDKAS